MTRFHLSSRVTILTGPFAGMTGRITQRAHPQVRPHLDWCIDLDHEFRAPAGAEWTACSESELGPYQVPRHARPVATGVLR